jgi:hypothetical protein
MTSGARDENANRLASPPYFGRRTEPPAGSTFRAFRMLIARGCRA